MYDVTWDYLIRNREYNSTISTLQFTLNSLQHVHSVLVLLRRFQQTSLGLSRRCYLQGINMFNMFNINSWIRIINNIKF